MNMQNELKSMYMCLQLLSVLVAILSVWVDFGKQKNLVDPMNFQSLSLDQILNHNTQLQN